MVKNKSGRGLNPADAARKAERAKAVARNKKERTLTRAAGALTHDLDAVRAELGAVLAAEADGGGNATLRLKKKALQAALGEALAKQRTATAAQAAATAGPSGGAGGGPRAEDSVYFHPTLNPAGAPPPGKPQRWKEGVVAPGVDGAVPGFGGGGVAAAVAAATAAAAAQGPLLPPPWERRGGRPGGAGG